MRKRSQEEEEPYIPGDDVPEYPDDDPDGDRAEFINHPMWQDIEEIPEVRGQLMVQRFPYGYARPSGGGGPMGMGTMLTWDQMMTKKTVYNLHPEVRRRLKALIEHAASRKVPLGVGTGWRVQPNPPPRASPSQATRGTSPARSTLRRRVPSPSTWCRTSRGTG